MTEVLIVNVGGKTFFEKPSFPTIFLLDLEFTKLPNPFSPESKTWKK